MSAYRTNIRRKFSNMNMPAVTAFPDDYVITDKYVEVLPGRTLMGHESYPIVISKGSIV